ncbi:hypothetical protein [Actinomadura citrea]|jgi:hypothetical protein|uniref:Uncharacterized protein n=1 Tax=Actinomadura citrea TaxID=46158 RepID=A0A7Y9KF92_9ACTN|nr:hypothetical protein [Actinomadura citrea]NYE15355.1 hypothetical protein [Actinomadura citrea]GGT99805.1 hypothetical protein GCM10010177_68720 [Actinomadura citrea]
MRTLSGSGLWKAANLWKALGVAGFLGVAATGAVIVRAERRRRSYTPDEIRERLHERLDGSPEERA